MHAILDHLQTALQTDPCAADDVRRHAYAAIHLGYAWGVNAAQDMTQSRALKKALVSGVNEALKRIVTDDPAAVAPSVIHPRVAMQHWVKKPTEESWLSACGVDLHHTILEFLVRKVKAGSLDAEEDATQFLFSTLVVDSASQKMLVRVVVEHYNRNLLDTMCRLPDWTFPQLALHDVVAAASNLPDEAIDKMEACEAMARLLTSRCPDTMQVQSMGDTPLVAACEVPSACLVLKALLEVAQAAARAPKRRRRAGAQSTSSTELPACIARGMECHNPTAVGILLEHSTLQEVEDGLTRPEVLESMKEMEPDTLCAFLRQWKCHGIVKECVLASSIVSALLMGGYHREASAVSLMKADIVPHVKVSELPTSVVHLICKAGPTNAVASALLECLAEEGPSAWDSTLLREPCSPVVVAAEAHTTSNRSNQRLLQLFQLAPRRSHWMAAASQGLHCDAQGKSWLLRLVSAENCSPSPELMRTVLAYFKGRKKAFEALLDMTHEGITPVHAAMARGHTDTSIALLESMAPPKQLQVIPSVLKLCATHNNEEGTQKLLQHFPEPPLPALESAFHIAMSKHNFHVASVIATASGFDSKPHTTDIMGKLQQLHSERLCVICGEAERQVIFVPCMHFATCRPCASKCVEQLAADEDEEDDVMLEAFLEEGSDSSSSSEGDSSGSDDDDEEEEGGDSDSTYRDPSDASSTRATRGLSEQLTQAITTALQRAQVTIVEPAAGVSGGHGDLSGQTESEESDESAQTEVLERVRAKCPLCRSRSVVREVFLQ